MKYHWLYIEFGKRVRSARGKAGLTQEMLASRIGLSRTSVTNIEKGRQKVSLDMVYTVAKALGVDPVTFLPEAAGVKQQEDEALKKVLLKAGASAESHMDWAQRIIKKKD